MSEQWLSVAEAAMETGLSEATVRRWVDAFLAGGQPGSPGVLVGRLLLLRRGRGRVRQVDAGDARRVARELGTGPRPVTEG